MYVIITNPVAGRGLALGYQQLLVDTLAKHGLKATTMVTEKPNQAYQMAKDACAVPGTQGIIGIGGDGTIQEIVAGMEAAYPGKIPIPLGIFPGGSGNDFAMALEGGKKAYNKKYKKDKTALAEVFVQRIAKGAKREIDLIAANGQAYLVAANLGIDARIVHNAIALKPKFGGQAYLAAAYKSITQHKNIPLQIAIDGGEKIAQDCTLVAICNNRTYGGGLAIAPPAQFDDGKITLCIVDGMSRLRLGALFPSILVEKHTNLKEITFVNCDEVTITLPPGGETLCLDGNLLQTTGEIHFKILPKVLSIFA